MNPKAELWWAVVTTKEKTYGLFPTKGRAKDCARWGVGLREIPEPVSVVRDGGKLAKGKG